MALVFRSFKRLLYCLYRFGPMLGFQNIAKILLPRQRQVEIRIPGYRAPISLRTGTADVDTFEKVFLARHYDLAVDMEPEFIVDAGANIGCVSVFFANRHPNAQIIAIEPEGSNFDLLVQNTQPYPNIRTIKAALWKEKTVLSIMNPHKSTDTFQVAARNGEDSSLVETITVYDVLNMCHGKSIDIFKIDIESAEKEVFEAICDDWIRSVRIFAIEFHDRMKPGTSRAFYRAVINYEFSQYNLGENTIVYK